jgi:hypothetical protein
LSIELVLDRNADALEGARLAATISLRRLSGCLDRFIEMALSDGVDGPVRSLDSINLTPQHLNGTKLLAPVEFDQAPCRHLVRTILHLAEAMNVRLRHAAQH